MARSGPHQTSPHQAESTNVHQQDEFLNLERQRDRKNYQDTTYRQRSRTLPSESFSCEDEHLHRRKRMSPSRKGVVNDVMKKVLSQISKSPFTRGIERAKLPRRFHQPTFAIYNGRTDPVEHVS